MHKISLKRGHAFKEQRGYGGLDKNGPIGLYI